MVVLWIKSFASLINLFIRIILLTYEMIITENLREGRRVAKKCIEFSVKLKFTNWFCQLLWQIGMRALIMLMKSGKQQIMQCESKNDSSFQVVIVGCNGMQAVHDDNCLNANHRY